MRALLDVNVLIALLDVDHTSHHRAKVWFAQYGEHGWATCPLTQNGCLRIMSGRGYSNPLKVSEIVERLRQAVEHPLHEFWSDSISVLNPTIVDAQRLYGHSQLTDVYLLALAVSRGGRLVTFDRRIATAPVLGVRPEHLVLL